LKSQNEGSKETGRLSIEEQKTLFEEDGTVTGILMCNEIEVLSRVKPIAGASADRKECKSLFLLQFNFNSVNNKAIEFWNLVDTYNSDIVTGKESWLREDISVVQAFSSDFKTFRKISSACGGGSFYLC
jgi:hypothetical protein